MGTYDSLIVNIVFNITRNLKIRVNNVNSSILKIKYKMNSDKAKVWRLWFWLFIWITWRCRASHQRVFRTYRRDTWNRLFKRSTNANNLTKNNSENIGQTYKDKFFNTNNVWETEIE